MRRVMAVQMFAFAMVLSMSSVPVHAAQADQPKVSRTRAAKHVLRVAAKASDNYTAKAGRGEPSLDDITRPAAWVHIDGKDGEYGKKDGKPDAVWTIKDAVGASPSFRVDVHSPLLGDPKDFVATFYSEKQAEGARIAYSIKAKNRSFEVGKKYSLLNPGEAFVVRNLSTGDVVTQIPPLPSGTYILAAGIKNSQTKKHALAMTRFSVGDGK